MNTVSLPVQVNDCWNTIGVRGDRSCPELAKHVHCQNCPVFADAGRRFLDAPSPPGYLEEWTGRLAAAAEEAATDAQSVLIFRLAEEWLALPVAVLVEVTPPRPVHRVPHRAGLLAGLVNIRGELQLCVHLTKLLGMNPPPAPPPADGEPRDTRSSRRFLVVRREADRWVLPVDAVERVCRVARRDIHRAPATVQRATAHIASGVFSWEGRPVGLLDEARLFEALRRNMR
jgi:chemotaxis-related protein WspD